jgi:hypothetical protein
MKSRVCPLAAGCIGKAAAGFRSPGGCASVEAVFTKPCARQYKRSQETKFYDSQAFTIRKISQIRGSFPHFTSFPALCDVGENAMKNARMETLACREKRLLQEKK